MGEEVAVVDDHYHMEEDKDVDNVAIEDGDFVEEEAFAV